MEALACAIAKFKICQCSLKTDLPIQCLPKFPTIQYMVSPTLPTDPNLHGQVSSNNYSMCLLWCIVIAESRRTNYVSSLKLKRGIRHMINRANVFDSVVTLYTSMLTQILDEYPFRVKYRDENTFDIGGVSRDMFSAFF